MTFTHFVSFITEVKTKALSSFHEDVVERAPSTENEAFKHEYNEVVPKYCTDELESISCEFISEDLRRPSFDVNNKNELIPFQGDPKNEADNRVFSPLPFNEQRNEHRPVKKSPIQVSSEFNLQSSTIVSLDSHPGSIEELNYPENSKQMSKTYVSSDDFSNMKWNVAKESCMKTSLDQITNAFRARKCVDDKFLVNRFHVGISPDKNEIAEEELKKEISKNMFGKVKNFFVPTLVK